MNFALKVGRRRVLAVKLNVEANRHLAAGWVWARLLKPKRGPPQNVRLSEWWVPSMGANLWGASPLWEYRLGLIVSKDKH